MSVNRLLASKGLNFLRVSYVRQLNLHITGASRFCLCAYKFIGITLYEMVDIRYSVEYFQAVLTLVGKLV